MRENEFWIVQREAFLIECFASYTDRQMLQRMIKSSPLDAGMDPSLIHQVSQEVIRIHAIKAAGASMCASLAPGVLRLPTAWIEYASFVYETLLLTQKLLYLYTGMKQNQLLHHHQLQGYLAIFFGATTALKATGIALGELSEATVRHWIKGRLASLIPLVGAGVNTALTSAAIDQLANEFVSQLQQRHLQHQTYLTISCQQGEVIRTPLFAVNEEESDEKLG